LSALSFSSLLGTQAKEPKRIRPDDTVPVELNARERELILEHSFAEPELTDRLRILPRPNEPPVYRFTLDDLDELRAGHTVEERQERPWSWRSPSRPRRASVFDWRTTGALATYIQSIYTDNGRDANEQSPGLQIW